MNTIQLVKTSGPFAKKESIDSNMLHKMGNDFNNMKNEIIAEGCYTIRGSAGQVKVVPLNIFKTIAHSDFNKWDTDFLVDYIIRTHQGVVEKNAVTIYKLVQKVAYRHSDEHPELLTLTEVTFLFLHDLLNQMTKEANTFFPHSSQIKKIKNPQRHGNSNSEFLKDRIKLLQDAHENVFNYLKVIRKITNNYRIPHDACHSYRSLFEKMKQFEEDVNFHFILEKNILLERSSDEKIK